MPLDARQHHTLMCLTQDGLPWSHTEQTRRFCAGGARWIQLRMKTATQRDWLLTAKAVVEICREFSAICIVNDSAEIAIEAGADGAHLGKLDLEWERARKLLGPNKILGGTINNREDAVRAIACGSLDYAGVGPWRFTTNKKNLAPLLAPEAFTELIALLKPLPVWAIGGIEVADLDAVSRTGAAGVAVSSALLRSDRIENNVSAFAQQWGLHARLSSKATPDVELPSLKQSASRVAGAFSSSA